MADENDAKTEARTNAEPVSAKTKAPLDPGDPLTPAIEAMERGDLLTAKGLAREIVGRAGVDPAVKTRAENLLSQLAPDSVTVLVMVASGILALALYAIYHR